jgi:hypothetical protein
MIVRPASSRILLITQPDHARLARSIMEHCIPLRTWPRRAEILHAIEQHDNGWTEEDAAPRVHRETGEVVDFITAPVNVRQAVWPRAIKRLSSRPWAAALVAEHALTIYERFRFDAEWSTFFSGIEAERDAMVRASGTSADDLLPDYAFLGLADVISLTFCTGWTGEQRFGDWKVERSGMQVFVSPSIGNGAEIPIEIAAREIPVQRFRSDADLRDAVSKATAVTLRGAVTGRSRA